MRKTKNPVINSVLEKFETVYKMTSIFASENGSATNGLLISGDAGTGKTHWVKKGLYEILKESEVEYIKGASVSAPAIYMKLFTCRHPGQVLVLDDVDIIHKSGSELSAILDLFKGATEMTKGERIIGWERAGSNSMSQKGIPSSFDFQGSIIWITNDSLDNLAKKAKGHWHAISSRFNTITVYLNEQEKLLYTLHLIEEGLLGADCEAKQDGYSEEIIEKTTGFILDNYKDFESMTPRIAIKIADLMFTYPEDWKMLVEQQFIK
jgi:Cdc6-like AAA superfamily ATPase